MTSWAGLCPGNNTSAGKSKNAHITKGNPYLKSMLCEIAWSITRNRDSYLANWYRRIKFHKGPKRAIVALARKILVMIYTMLKHKSFYDNDIYELRRQKSEQKRTDRMVQELTRLGYDITVLQSVIPA